jgi:hypothetical protein
MVVCRCGASLLGVLWLAEKWAMVRNIVIYRSMQGPALICDEVKVVALGRILADASLLMAVTVTCGAASSGWPSGQEGRKHC